MSIQKHFKLSRFLKAFKYDLAINAKTYLFFVLGLFFGLLFIDLYFISNHYGTFSLNNYQPLFFFTFIISMILVVGSSFPLLRDTKSTANYLMLPISVFEKFLIQFVIRLVVFTILFLPLFWFDFKLADLIYNLFEWRNKTVIENFELLFDAFSELKTKLDLWAVLLGMFSFASFLFSGAVYFKKYAVFKTVASFSLIVCAMLLFSSMLTLFFFPKGFNSQNAFIDLNTYKVSEHLYSIQLFFYIIGFVSSLFLIPLAYFKLKEKEL